MVRRAYRLRLSSPRPWGCFQKLMARCLRKTVFPTPVGVFLVGDIVQRTIRRSSPRPWGCFWHPQGRPCLLMVFPTPVGVFPPSKCVHIWHESLPHARGGVSLAGSADPMDCLSSPRPWGCFYTQVRILSLISVFPTPVGVFLMAWPLATPSACLPHARGGVSYIVMGGGSVDESSPRPWGCFPR